MPPRRDLPLGMRFAHEEEGRACVCGEILVVFKL